MTVGDRNHGPRRRAFARGSVVESIPVAKGYVYDTSTMRRSDFLRDRRRFCSRRFSLDAREGLVGIRDLAVWFNPMSFRRRRWRARSLLRPWKRCSDATTVIPVGTCTSLTALSTLLRCWPPGPPPRKGWNCTSLRRISGLVLCMSGSRAVLRRSGLVKPDPMRDPATLTYNNPARRRASAMTLSDLLSDVFSLTLNASTSLTSTAFFSSS